MRRALLLAIAVAAGCSDEPTQRRREVMPEMVASRAYESFASGPGDEPAMRLPPRGAVARGALPFAFGSGLDAAARAGREVVNPIASDAVALVRGKVVFDGMCAVCHGASGHGDGALVPKFPAPPSLAAEHARAMRDGEVFHAISLGRGLMPAHAGQLAAGDRWRAVLYVRALQAHGAAAGGR